MGDGIRSIAQQTEPKNTGVHRSRAEGFLTIASTLLEGINNEELLRDINLVLEKRQRILADAATTSTDSWAVLDVGYALDDLNSLSEALNKLENVQPFYANIQTSGGIAIQCANVDSLNEGKLRVPKGSTRLNPTHYMEVTFSTKNKGSRMSVNPADAVHQPVATVQISDRHAYYENSENIRILRKPGTAGVQINVYPDDSISVTPIISSPDEKMSLLADEEFRSPPNHTGATSIKKSIIAASPQRT